ncbi:Metallo-dependent hydrolase [Ramaria rubella]|nr:Metallo-dependent hydrolase [Ramaria rubella]
MVQSDLLVKVFVGTFVGCPQLGQLQILNDYLLQIDDCGYVSAFVPRDSDKGREIMAETPPGAINILSSHSFILSTFCDLHLHAPQMLYLGTGLHLPLLEWLDNYAYKAEERIDENLELASRVYKQLAKRLIGHGTGAVLLFGTIKAETNLLLAKIFQDSGIRAFVGKLSMDISTRPSYVESSAEASANSARNFIRDCKDLVSHLPAHKRLVQPVITPRFVPTCTTDLLLQLGNLAIETSAMIQSHLAEAKDQVEWVKQDRGMDDMDVFDQSGLLNARTIQAHCTFLPSSSLAHLHSKGTSIAHCPLSNAYFSSRPFALREALNSGVTVGLGTDIAGGYQIDIMASMRMAVIISRMRENQRIESGTDESSLEIDWKEALYLATKGGASALGLEVPVGEYPFQVGLPFDAQQIDLYDEGQRQGVGNIDFFDTPPGFVTESVVEKWWSLGDGQNRSAVYIQGRNVF